MAIYDQIIQGGNFRPFDAFAQGANLKQQAEANQLASNAQRMQNAQKLGQQIAKGVQNANTPEQWDQLVDTLTSQGVQGAEKYRGKFDQKDAVLKMFGVAPKPPTYAFKEAGAGGDQKQLFAFNEADPTKAVPLGKPFRPKAQVEINQGGFKKINEKFAPEYVNWKASGGYADVAKNVSQLEGAINNLESGINTGFVEGITPDVVKSIVNPELLAVKQQVEEVVQRNLRLILGAQFTEKEGERLISRAFDDKLPTEENIRRVKNLVKQIDDAAKAKQASVDYYDANGTLEGFQGSSYTKSDFTADKVFSKPTQQPKMGDVMDGYKFLGGDPSDINNWEKQ